MLDVSRDLDGMPFLGYLPITLLPMSWSSQDSNLGHPNPGQMLLPLSYWSSGIGAENRLPKFFAMFKVFYLFGAEFPSCGELVMQKKSALLMVGLKLYEGWTHVNVGMKLVIVMVADLLTQALAVSPNNSLPRPGMRVSKGQTHELINSNWIKMEVFYCLQSQLNPPFCLGLIVITMTEPTLLYIYENSTVQVRGSSNCLE